LWGKGRRASALRRNANGTHNRGKGSQLHTHTHTCIDIDIDIARRLSTAERAYAWKEEAKRELIVDCGERVY